MKRVNLGLKEALKEKEERKRKRQELEDKGWVTQKIGEKTVVIEPIIAEIKKPIPPKVPDVDPKELEITRLKALLAEKEAAVIEETIEEVVLETAAELAEEEDTIKEDGE